MYVNILNLCGSAQQQTIKLITIQTLWYTAT